MNISVFGMGYVGAVISACFAKAGHMVIGVDNIGLKVDMINNGRSPIIEKDLEELISQGVKKKKLSATLDPQHAVHSSDVSFICVGTPSLDNGALELTYLLRVCENIGNAIKHKESRHIVCIRSTVIPGTIEQYLIPALEKSSGKKASIDFGVCVNPEFLRESTAIEDFLHPPKTVIGSLLPEDADRIAEIYKDIKAPLIKTSLSVAALVKYSDNAFHALKLTFANEIGAYAKQCGVDAHQVMEIFCQDKQLNISPAYLKPGFAYGGSCLPKDLRALTHAARNLDLNLPILENISHSNQRHIQYAINLVRAMPGKKVGLLGLSFKSGTDDLREAPQVEMIEQLLGKGYEIKIYDRNVSLAKLTGANKAYIEEKIPHLANLLVNDSHDITSFAETIIIGNHDPLFAQLLPNLRADQYVLDLVRIAKDIQTPAHYEGLCWAI